ncbi:cysteine--tRNA ligase 2, cytoplasmic-like [Rhododendron vialii]|uniref:cysteine--tRNA ligase 2, cytoplasmic-like n=1 Tax=Rhododendron vialii TaxID=182163 RepID=UPI00265F5D76|nr:cysteine--tRNA ligase 2, cytoplasmic-like [Rhododendron vialii]
MTREKELFVPKVPGKVGMYISAVSLLTKKPMSAMSVLVFYHWVRCSVPIIAKANMREENIFTLANHFIGKFHDDMDRPSTTYSNSIVLDRCLESRFLLTSSQRGLFVFGRSGQTEIAASFVFGLKMSSSKAASGKKLRSQTIHNDCASIVDGDVYFSLDKYPNFGCLSGNSREDLLVTPDPKKRDPHDFALWKPSKPGEPYWDSPWGHGRHGWHIECSAMSSHYLSIQFDIHGGGRDLIVPHHENEIATSWAACQASKVGYWVHIGRVNIGDDKMSKSLGNHIPIHEISCELVKNRVPVPQNEPYYSIVRVSSCAPNQVPTNEVLHNHIIGQPLFGCWDFGDKIRSNCCVLPVLALGEELKEQRDLLLKLNYANVMEVPGLYFVDLCIYIHEMHFEGQLQFSLTCFNYSMTSAAFSISFLHIPDTKNGKTTQISGEAKNCIYRLRNDFQSKMSDDLQTSPVLGSILPESLRFINKVLDSLKGKPKQHLPLIQSLIEIEKVVKEVLSILGLLSALSYTEVVLQLKEKALDRANMKEDQVMDLIRKRAQAWKERDFSSDQIRRDLAAKGIDLMDVGKETIWRPCVPHKYEDQALLTLS